MYYLSVMKTLSTEILWFNQQSLHKSMRISSCVCMCATEGMIQSQREPERMRAFMLVAVLFDQLVHSRFHPLHEDFYQVFTVPKLLAHSGCGCATPDWLLSHEHGFDENVDWLLIEELATGASSEILRWIQQRRDIAQNEFESMLQTEIIDTFEPEHQEKLLRVFHAGAKGCINHHADNMETTPCSDKMDISRFGQ
jgi:hypothetical protein